MDSKLNDFLQGDVWLFDPDPIVGNEIGTKKRPALIISCNSFNRGRSGLVIVIPMTSKCKKVLTHVQVDPPEGGLTQVSYCLCEQIRSVSVDRLISKIGSVKSKKIMRDIQNWIADLTFID